MKSLKIVGMLAIASFFLPISLPAAHAETALSPGDLIFCERNPIWPVGWDHVAIYVGPIGPNGEDVIEADKNTPEGTGVHWTTLEALRDRWDEIGCGKVTNDPNKISIAINFAKSKIGDGFDNRYWQKDENGDTWYCAELVWAAYKKAGINMDPDSGDVSAQEIWDYIH